MKLKSKIGVLLLVAGLMSGACNRVENQPSLTNSKVTTDNSDPSSLSQFQEFQKYFELRGLPTEVFHHSYVNPDPIPKDLTMKFLGFSGERDVHAFGSIPVAKNHIALVAAHEPFENVVYYELYIFDQKGKRISSLQIAGEDDVWLGMCVFEDNAQFRVESRTPDMDEDETEPLSTRLYKVDENGKIEVLEE